MYGLAAFKNLFTSGISDFIYPIGRMIWKMSLLFYVIFSFFRKKKEKK